MKNGKVLSHNVAVVTGSDSGIGQAIAVEFASNGADVVVNYFEDREGAEKTKASIEQAGGKAIVIQGDVGKPEDVQRLFDECERELGTATILVNNAGIDSTGKHVADLSPEEWNRAIQTNLTGPFLCSKRFISALTAKKSKGKIINISSVHEELPRAGAAEYCAGKGGLRNLMRCLTLELAEKGINVNNIAPGMVLTPMNQEAIDDPKKREEQVKTIPMKRAAEPTEIAKVALFLASPDSSYVDGSTYFVDGGLMQNLGQGA
jgi:glucose 1-dehydrogenase